MRIEWLLNVSRVGAGTFGDEVYRPQVIFHRRIFDRNRQDVCGTIAV